MGIQGEYLPQELGFGSGMTLLAAPGCLVRGRRLGEAAPTPAERAPVEEPAGLVAGGDRLLPRPGRTQGPKSGPSPVGRARPGSTHHIITDGQGRPACGVADRRQPQRRHPTAAPVGQDPGRDRSRRPAAQAARHTLRGPRLRPRQVPQASAAARHPARDRRTRTTARHRSGHFPLGRRAIDLLAARLPPPAHPLGTTQRHPRSLPGNRRLPDHPPPRPEALSVPVKWPCGPAVPRGAAAAPPEHPADFLPEPLALAWSALHGHSVETAEPNTRRVDASSRTTNEKDGKW
jgi:hypothetical protein